MAAPATVSGEPAPRHQDQKPGKAGTTKATTREPGDLPSHAQPTVGCDGSREMDIVTNLFASFGVGARAETASAALVALLLGSFLVIGAGFANADLLHSVAHDARHAFSFPCH